MIQTENGLKKMPLSCTRLKLNTKFQIVRSIGTDIVARLTEVASLIVVEIPLESTKKKQLDRPIAIFNV